MPVSVAAGGLDTIVFANAADMITNPTTADNNYQVSVYTSAEDDPRGLFTVCGDDKHGRYRMSQ